MTVALVSSIPCLRQQDPGALVLVHFCLATATGPGTNEPMVQSVPGQWRRDAGRAGPRTTRAFLRSPQLCPWADTGILSFVAD